MELVVAALNVEAVPVIENFCGHGESPDCRMDFEHVTFGEPEQDHPTLFAAGVIVISANAAPRQQAKRAILMIIAILASRPQDWAFVLMSSAPIHSASCKPSRRFWWWRCNLSG